VAVLTAAGDGNDRSRSHTPSRPLDRAAQVTATGNRRETGCLALAVWMSSPVDRGPTVSNPRRTVVFTARGRFTDAGAVERR
jgi:hypothetical protein